MITSLVILTIIGSGVIAISAMTDESTYKPSSTDQKYSQTETQSVSKDNLIKNRLKEQIKHDEKVPPKAEPAKTVLINGSKTKKLNLQWYGDKHAQNPNDENENAQEDSNQEDSNNQNDNSFIDEDSVSQHRNEEPNNEQNEEPNNEQNEEPNNEQSEELHELDLDEDDKEGVPLFGFDNVPSIEDFGAGVADSPAMVAINLPARLNLLMNDVQRMKEDTDEMLKNNAPQNDGQGEHESIEEYIERLKTLKEQKDNVAEVKKVAEGFLKNEEIIKKCFSELYENCAIEDPQAELMRCRKDPKYPDFSAKLLAVARATTVKAKNVKASTLLKIRDTFHNYGIIDLINVFKTKGLNTEQRDLGGYLERLMVEVYAFFLGEPFKYLVLSKNCGFPDENDKEIDPKTIFAPVPEVAENYLWYFLSYLGIPRGTDKVAKIGNGLKNDLPYLKLDSFKKEIASVDCAENIKTKLLNKIDEYYDNLYIQQLVAINEVKKIALTPSLFLVRSEYLGDTSKKDALRTIDLLIRYKGGEFFEKRLYEFGKFFYTVVIPSAKNAKAIESMFKEFFEPMYKTLRGCIKDAHDRLGLQSKVNGVFTGRVLSFDVDTFDGIGMKDIRYENNHYLYLRADLIDEARSIPRLLRTHFTDKECEQNFIVPFKEVLDGFTAGQDITDYKKSITVFMKHAHPDKIGQNLSSAQQEILDRAQKFVSTVKDFEKHRLKKGDPNWNNHANEFVPVD